MKEKMDITWQLVAATLFYVFVASVIRMEDPPVTRDWPGIVKIVVGCFIAAIIITWGLIEEGIDPVSFVGLVAVIGGSVGGLSAVKLIVNKFQTPASSPGPPTT
ncbi:MAG: hypothetical protein PHZ19_03595 [Candidatus Thermoplasmatota archaeon]|nr:hypothetical protein [Candidatus Thermoplasmatota archaeon]